MSSSVSVQERASRPPGFGACIHPLSSTDPTSPDDDLDFLQTRLSSARVVGLGEATHGTREFFLLKHRIIRFLVERLGFNLVALESSLPDTEALGAYVAGEDLDPRLALSAQRFWTWNTAEVLDLVRWLRLHNSTKAADRKVRFVGYDMQSPATSAMRLVELVEEADPGQGVVWARRLEPLLTDFNAECFSNRSEPEQAAVLGHLEALGQVKGLSGAEQHLRVVRQAASMFAALPDPREANRSRDQAMAANVASCLDASGPDAKVAVWAHNMHVQKQASPFMGPVTLGTELADRFGPEYVAIGFAFDRGSFQGLSYAHELVDHQVPSLGPESLDGALSEVGHDVLLVDFQAATDDVSDWLSTRPGTRCIGSGFGDQSAERVVVRQNPSESFDLLAFVAETTPARRNRERPAPPTPLEPVDEPTNLNFEADETGGLRDWSVDLGRDEGAFRVELFRDEANQAVLALERRECPWPWGTATVWQRVRGAFSTGRALMSAEMRTEGAGPNSGAQIFIRADTGLPGGDVLIHMLPAAGFRTTPVHRGPGWTGVEVSLDIPTGTKVLTYGFVMSGNGRAELKSLSLQVPDSEAVES